ncbi:MAG TPA: LCP family protein [Chloroflexota bacterium]|nr:LCP family protein [Chloroflexota bacterium]
MKRAFVLFFVAGLVCVPLAAGAALFLFLDGAFARLGVDGVTTAPRLPASSVEVPAWSSTQRVTLLLLGTDQREGETAPPRTDTIIVATLDPQSKTAGMVSLPRDLWVTIPGVGSERINSAYELGENARRGGGPDLARRTVEELLGVPVHHYALIGFSGFQKLVNEVGGVVVDVERPIKDNEYPDQDYSLRRIFFQPGLQRLDGESALWYVRTRHADSDFGRARRQQQFIMGLRRQALQLNLLPKAPAILSALSDTIKTDLRPTEIIGLARLAKELDAGAVVSRVIDESMTTHWVTPAGAQVELPDKSAVKRLAQDVFGSRA